MRPRARLCTLALALALGLSGGALAQSDPATEARAAAQQLEDATRALDAATGARDRVRALSQTVRAYEAGLQAMREGQRRAAIQQQALERDLAASEREIAQLLGVLQSMGSTPAPVTLLHPSGPVGTARSGMILADVTPGLTGQATALRAKLEDLAMLRALQESAASRLDEGLAGVQTARTALSQAIADRTDLPRRFTEDAVRTALLIASTESLDGFASGLSQIAVDEAPGSLPGIEDRKGLLPLPLEGRIIRRAGEADAAGIIRPGIVMAAPPRALVTTPAAATLRYKGPLLDYGTVAILEPQSGILLVLAGLDVVYGEIGQVLPGGSPVGLMGGLTAADDGIVPAELQEAATDWTETLYIEVRQDNTPVDPASWFRTDKED
ncbi:peptidoglycan DD-metalloendopeptidase family protein [Roseovarius sp. LXJ103]|uniref:murein hydrolase activator EnvC family protein n=1 Tax=Roseovarius carneus TaxID=2853164 RepID=UPI000D6094B5|nr:peptidoglycan DD-metalloendopeptidase family protein [Roseovarius carneus]MBZ8118131.1 peptidoglycan DD-metalloendopeptidase family protein [Roseovarius carneus]PWE36134.1 peptidase M23 [Pelagicola sp. LXJ1103]